MNTPPEVKLVAKGRFEQLNGFISKYAPESKLPPLTRLAWLVLFRHARDHKVSIAISVLIYETGMSRRAVQYALQQLIDKGFLGIICKGGYNKGLTTRVLSHKPREVKPQKAG